MNQHCTKLIGILLFLPFFLTSQTTPKVLIIGVDGCRSDALELANTPNLDALIANGLYSPDALNDDITISGPGWSAITCGVWSEKHLVTGNDFTNNNYAQYPHFFQRLEEHDPNLHAVSFCHWGPINDEIVQDHADFKLNLSSDELVATTAADYILANDLDVLFLHFDDVDHAGHGSGFSPDNPAYIEAIEAVDAHLTVVLNAIQNRTTYAQEDWLIMASTDHGGNGTSHGGNSLGEQRVFMIAGGPNIAQEVILRDSSIVTEVPENCLNVETELRFQAGANVAVAPNSAFDFGADQDFTIECRVRTSNAADVAIVGNKDWDSGLNKGFVFSFRYAAGPEWKVNIGDGANRSDLDFGGEIADNEWYTLSVSFDRDGLMKQYQDGVLIDETDISFIGDINTNEGLFFGTDILGAYQYDGAIAEVRVWNTLVNEADLLDWHCTTLDASHPAWNSLSGYWKMDEGSGGEVADASGNNLPGTINGATWETPGPTVVYDFTATPRLVDIVPTALTHLCIPINEDWDLDGQSLIPDCVMVDNENIIDAETGLLLSPNPAGDFLFGEIKHLGENADVLIYNLSGQLVLQRKKVEASFELNISKLVAGEYILRVETATKTLSSKFLKN